jgi:hypothetical protein
VSSKTASRQAGREVTPPQSQQWKSRAVEIARRKLRDAEPGVWETNFADWFAPEAEREEAE